MDDIRTRNRRYEARRKPVQDRSRASVDAILAAAAQVFDAEGYAEATTDRIAERAGVSVGTLYQYFPSKDALLVALFELHLDEAEAAFEALESEMTDDARVADLAGEMVERLFGLHRQNPGLHRILLEEAPLPQRVLARYSGLEQALREAWAGWLEGRVDDPAEVALLVMAIVESLAHRFTLFPVPAGHSAATLEAATVDVIVAYVQRPSLP